MVGQVSPEALLSRLHAEGGKTEAESEVSTHNTHTQTDTPSEDGEHLSHFVVCLHGNSIFNP